MKTTTQILISNIRQSDRDWFKKHCAKNNTDMSKEIRNFVKRLRENPGRG